MPLLAGTAAVDITPRKPLFLVGYPHVPRTSTGAHDPLLASALYLSNRGVSLLLIAVDSLFITRPSANLCRAAIARECDLPASNILISATHTHSAPVTATMLAWRDDPVVPSPDPEYMEQFHSGIVDAASQAVRSAAPAEIAVTATAEVNGVGCNRLAPDGPFDPQAGLIVVRAERQLRSVSLIYGMHPTVLHEDSTLVSSDFPHYTRERIREAFPGVTPIYHTAPCGNLSPRYHVRGQTFAEAERLGRRLGDFAIKALGALRNSDFSTDPHLGALCGTADLVPNSFPSVSTAETALANAIADFERLKCEGAPHGQVRTAECVVFGCQEAVTLARAQQSGETHKLQQAYGKTEVQTFRIGDTLIIGFPGEQFVEYALEVKRRSGHRAFMVSLGNGELQGYIVTQGAGAKPSYEAAFALFAPESGNRLVDTALNLERFLWT